MINYSKFLKIPIYLAVFIQSSVNQKGKSSRIVYSSALFVYFLSNMIGNLDKSNEPHIWWCYLNAVTPVLRYKYVVCCC